MAKSAMSRIEKELHDLRKAQLDRIPRHFGMKAFIGAVFGSLFFGISFALKGLLLQITRNFTEQQVWWICAAIVIVLSCEIYFIGYSYVPNRKQRPFGQFWFKRILTYVFVGFLVATFLVYLYGINNVADSPMHVKNIIVALAFPCCIGASIADLIKRY